MRRKRSAYLYPLKDATNVKPVLPRKLSALIGGKAVASVDEDYCRRFKAAMPARHKGADTQPRHKDVGMCTIAYDANPVSFCKGQEAVYRVYAERKPVAGVDVIGGLKCREECSRRLW